MTLAVWQAFEANEWIREIGSALAAGRDVSGPPPDMPGPYALADPARIRAVLAQAGYRDTMVTAVETPMRLGADAADARQFVLGSTGWMLVDLDDEQRAGALASLQTVLDAHAGPDGVLMGSASWIVTATTAG
jgi:hypothetical protein